MHTFRPRGFGSPRQRGLPLTLGSVLLAACARSPVPCTLPGDCDEAQDCVAYVCRPHGADPVAPSSQRVVLLPSKIAWVEPEPGSTRSFYVDFELPEGLPERELDALDSAILRCEPPAGLEARAALSVQRVIDPWTAGRVSSGNEPRLGAESARGWLQPGVAANVEVTALVRSSLGARRQAHGFALLLPPPPNPAQARAEPPDVQLDLYVSEDRTAR